ncbi:MAG: restriction endonuclease [Gammaproteobacteria bacterium]|nr:restriction endonuclease [Gammaproteobacteria bacterium]
MARHSVPKYQDLLWPTLRALITRGGSASIHELSEQIASDMKLSDEVLDVLHSEGPQSEFEYRLAWTRTYLKKYARTVDNTSRGIWTITTQGRKIKTEDKLRKLVRDRHAEETKTRRTQGKMPGGGNDHDEINGSEWKEVLLKIIRGIKPGAFERLCQFILRESGFLKVDVTGHSGDGGIDGTGILRVNLLSFHVRFQCKRYTGSVGARDIRDFRGAIIGRADKGLFITTGRFTKDAEREAIRDGAPAIDLIDGEALCDLLKDRSIGVTVKTKTVETVIPEKEYFTKF